MLSPIFWLSLVAVFLGIRWIATGLMSLASAEIRVKRPAGATVVLAPRSWHEGTPAALDEAA